MKFVKSFFQMFNSFISRFFYLSSVEAVAAARKSDECNALEPLFLIRQAITIQLFFPSFLQLSAQ